MDYLPYYIILQINGYLNNYEKSIFARTNPYTYNFFRNELILEINISDKTCIYILQLYKNIKRLVLFFDNSVNTIMNKLCTLSFPNLIEINIKSKYNSRSLTNYVILNRHLKEFISNNLLIENLHIDNCSALSDFTVLYIINNCKQLKKVNLINCNSLSSLSLDKVSQLY